MVTPSLGKVPSRKDNQYCPIPHPHPFLHLYNCYRLQLSREANAKIHPSVTKVAKRLIKATAPSSASQLALAFSTQGPFLLEGLQELCRHDLTAGGISSIWGKFKPREGASTNPAVRRWKPGVWKCVLCLCGVCMEMREDLFVQRKTLGLSHIPETFGNYRWNFYKSIPSGRLMSFTKWLNCKISLYNWVHFNAERGRFA